MEKNPTPPEDIRTVPDIAGLDVLPALQAATERPPAEESNTTSTPNDSITPCDTTVNTGY